MSELYSHHDREHQSQRQQQNDAPWSYSVVGEPIRYVLHVPYDRLNIRFIHVTAVMGYRRTHTESLVRKVKVISLGLALTALGRIAVTVPLMLQDDDPVGVGITSLIAFGLFFVIVIPLMGFMGAKNSSGCSILMFAVVCVIGGLRLSIRLIVLSVQGFWCWDSADLIPISILDVAILIFLIMGGVFGFQLTVAEPMHAIPVAEAIQSPDQHRQEQHNV